MFSTRRQFLKASFGASTLLSLGGPVPGFLARAAAAQSVRPAGGEKILVVVQMAGGNDGLNTVVPYADDVYQRGRPTLRLTARQVHKIDSYLGFHPRMPGFLRLLDEGHLSVVQGVGYPHLNRNHEAGMHIWQTAVIDPARATTGWLGRAVDHVHRSETVQVPAAYTGEIAQPFTLRSERTIIPTIRTLDDATLQPGPFANGGRKLAAAEQPDGSDPLLDFVRRGAAAADARSRQLEAIARARTSARAAGYPHFQFAEMLYTIAELIRADVGIRIYYTELGGPSPGGFDNHAGQLENHAALLEQLSESLAGFVHDLARDGLLDRVLLMTFSEFGRTLRENGRRGTDHGTAAPMFLAGGRLSSRLIGGHPSLTDLDAADEMKFHIDFRQVYATALDQWLGIDSRAVLGERFEPVAMLRG
jgi:uncharacterized protein (DUF1501 family)